jgi:heme exporter protein B
MGISSVLALIRKEASLEWRQKTAFGGVMLYLVSTVFVCYLSFSGIIPDRTWNALFWIIMLFASFNAILKGFIQEGSGRLVWYYTLVPAQVLLNAKIIYNALVMVVLSLLGWLVFVVFMGDPIQNHSLFFTGMLLGISGLSAVLTMVSAIAGKARNNFTLMGVLSFPLVLPQILVLIRVSGAAIQGEALLSHWQGLLVLLLLTGLGIVLANLLFPYIWRE